MYLSKTSLVNKKEREAIAEWIIYNSLHGLLEEKFGYIKNKVETCIEDNSLGIYRPIKNIAGRVWNRIQNEVNKPQQRKIDQAIFKGKSYLKEEWGANGPGDTSFTESKIPHLNNESDFH